MRLSAKARKLTVVHSELPIIPATQGSYGVIKRKTAVMHAVFKEEKKILFMLGTVLISRRYLVYKSQDHALHLQGGD